MEDLITTQWGTQARPFRAYSKEELSYLLNRASSLMSEIKQHTGISVFLSYGCLLGAVRSGEVIPHDFDVDVGFIVPDGSFSEILNTANKLIGFLIGKGFSISAQSNGHFKAAYHEELFSIDVEFFAAWSNGKSLYHYFAVRGAKIADDILPLGSITLSGIEFPAPKDPEVMLAAIYGPNWRKPDPSFKYELTADDWHNFDFLFTDTNRDFWDNYYSNRIDNKVWLESPSQFAALIGSNNPPGSRILDIGCGNGRDSIFFASLGLDVTCVDYSEKALEVCKATADRRALKIQTEVLSVASFSDIREFENSHGGEFDIVYARFFLHAIDENAERNLLRLAYNVLKFGGQFALEYRCLESHSSNVDDSNYENGKHYRRLILQSEFELSANELNFEIEYSTQGFGYAKFRSEDPLIGRTILRKVKDDLIK